MVIFNQAGVCVCTSSKQMLLVMQNAVLLCDVLVRKPRKREVEVRTRGLFAKMSCERRFGWFVCFQSPHSPGLSNQVPGLHFLSA